MTSRKRLNLPFSDEEWSFSLPAANLAEVLTPAKSLPLEDLQVALRKSLNEPIGSPPLAGIVKAGDRVLILSDDNTRLTPVHLLLPALFEELGRIGVKDEQVTILMALGTHRAMTAGEMKEKVGEPIFGRVRVLNHDYKDESSMVDLGTTRNGTRIEINRLALESDVVIGLGSIVPHHIPGYSGGAKIVQPGICGARTTAETHLLSVRSSENLLGILDNPVRRELDEIGDRVGLKFIINTVLNPEGQVSLVVTGDPRKAFVRGTEGTREIYGVPFHRTPEIVIAGSHPCNLDFWQAHKSLYSAERVVAEDGVIIIATPCPEGVSPQHPYLVDFAHLPAREIEDRYRRGAIQSGVAAALAIAWAMIRAKKKIISVSPGMKEEDQRNLGFLPAGTLDEALEMALALKGRDASVSVLTHAPDTLPLRAE